LAKKKKKNKRKKASDLINIKTPRTKNLRKCTRRAKVWPWKKGAGARLGGPEDNSRKAKLPRKRYVGERKKKRFSILNRASTRRRRGEKGKTKGVIKGNKSKLLRRGVRGGGGNAKKKGAKTQNWRRKAVEVFKWNNRCEKTTGK